MINSIVGHDPLHAKSTKFPKLSSDIANVGAGAKLPHLRTTDAREVDSFLSVVLQFEFRASSLLGRPIQHEMRP
jgi:hypothetical protein